MGSDDDDEEAASEQNPDNTDTPPGPHLPATDLPLGCHLQDEGTCQGAYELEYILLTQWVWYPTVRMLVGYD